MNKLNSSIKKEYVNATAKYTGQFIILVITAWILGGFGQLVICATTSRAPTSQPDNSYGQDIYSSQQTNQTSDTVDTYVSNSIAKKTAFAMKAIQTTGDSSIETLCSIYGYKIGLNPDPIQAILGLFGILILYTVFRIVLICKRIFIASKYKSSAGKETPTVNIHFLSEDDDDLDSITINLNGDDEFDSFDELKKKD